MKSFPQPLCDKEEAEMLIRCQNGDKEARDRLIECNLRLVVHIVKRYQTPERELDDLISIGTIGLIKAIDSYNSGKSIKLATYAAKCIDNELLMFLRCNRKQSKEVFLYDPIGHDKEGNEIELIDVMESPEEDIVGRLELRRNIKWLNDNIEKILSEREMLIINKRYGMNGEEERTQRELAASLGISRSYVSRIEKKALAKLRDDYTIQQER